jgi:hypothetical protein
VGEDVGGGFVGEDFSVVPVKGQMSGELLESD